MLLFIANNQILFFCISILTMKMNRHIFFIRICKREESIMLYPICACSYVVRYSMYKKDSSTRMRHSQSFLNSIYMKDLVFEL
jgi:hypothetical protein